MGGHAILCLTMKRCLFVPGLLLTVLPTLGLAQGTGAPVPGADGGAPVFQTPAEADSAEPRNARSLRESLRQPVDAADAKPYRMSAEERQRMRELLRDQSSLREQTGK